jgi:sigma-B regulation protein RsbU (phosphoserine phosphatase)
MESVVRCIEMGAEDYLPKPFDPVLLRARINACLEKKRLRDKEALYLAQIQEVLNQLNVELAEAAAYVKTLLPDPIMGEKPSVDWRFIPSTALGGDCFGYHRLDDDHFAVYLVDVCGHGVGAALLSVSVTNVLRSHTLQNTDFREPDQVLNGLNSAFPMDKHDFKYFTIWYGVYNKSSRTLVYASGGHHPALLLRGSFSKKAQVIQLMTPNLFIGAMPDLAYKKAVHELEGPCRLYVFSDGVFEIAKTDGAIWEFEDFVEFMAQPPVEGQSCMDRLLNHVQELSGSETLDDDFSILEVIIE